MKHFKLKDLLWFVCAVLCWEGGNLIGDTLFPMEEVVATDDLTTILTVKRDTSGYFHMSTQYFHIDSMHEGQLDSMLIVLATPER